MRDESAMYRGKQAYMQTQVSTVGQDKLLLLLYDGALKFLSQARAHIMNKDVASKGLCISKALDVLTELAASINQEVGGELARNLYQLYMICSSKLLRANLMLDLGLIAEVSTVLTELRNAYAEIMLQPEVQAAAQQIAMRHEANTMQTAWPLAKKQSIVSTGMGHTQPRAVYAQKVAAVYGQLQQRSSSTGPKV